MTLEAITELASKLDSQPSITPEDLSEFAERLAVKMQSQPGVTRETLTEVIGKLEDRMEAQPAGIIREAIGEITESLEKRMDERIDSATVSKSDIGDIVSQYTAPLLSRIKAQEKMLLKREKQIRKQPAPSPAPLPVMPPMTPPPGYRQAPSQPGIDYELRRKLEEQDRLIRKQEKQMRKQDRLLEAVPQLEKAVNALANLPDPNVTGFRGDAIYKTQASADPAGARSMSEIAERTQAMMLSEWETQARTSPDPALREVAWRQILKIRGLSNTE